MSEALTTISNPGEALLAGGVGIGAAIFKGRPQIMELVQRTTRQEGAIPGKFRNTATNEHFDTLRVVLLDAPREQREYYLNNGTFSKDNKLCFSTDNVQPHSKAKQPQALYCATCPKGDIKWKKWRDTKDPKDLPECGMFYHLFFADRSTQTAFYFNVKGTSVKPFKDAMETQMYGILQKVVAYVKQTNKARGYTQTATGWVPNPEFVLPEGKTEREPIEPMPNVFDISFELYVTTRDKGGPPVIGCRDFKLMQPAERAEFGAMYVDFATRRQSLQAEYEAQANAAEETQSAAAAVSQPAVPAVVLPGVPVAQAEPAQTAGPITGEIVGKDEPIVI